MPYELDVVHDVIVRTILLSQVVLNTASQLNRIAHERLAERVRSSMCS